MPPFQRQTLLGGLVPIVVLLKTPKISNGTRLMDIIFGRSPGSRQLTSADASREVQPCYGKFCGLPQGHLSCN